MNVKIYRFGKRLSLDGCTVIGKKIVPGEVNFVKSNGKVVRVERTPYTLSLDFDIYAANKNKLTKYIYALNRKLDEMVAVFEDEDIEHRCFLTNVAEIDYYSRTNAVCTLTFEDTIVSLERKVVVNRNGKEIDIDSVIETPISLDIIPKQTLKDFDIKLIAEKEYNIMVESLVKDDKLVIDAEYMRIRRNGESYLPYIIFNEFPIARDRLKVYCDTNQADVFVRYRRRW